MGLKKDMHEVRVFKLQSYHVPHFLTKLRRIRLYAYITEIKPNGEVISIFETSYDGDPTHVKYTTYNNITGEEKEITREEFNQMKPVGVDAASYHMYIHLHKFKIYVILINVDSGDTYGFTDGGYWPWLRMFPHEIDDFMDRCIADMKNHISRHINLDTI